MTNALNRGLFSTRLLVHDLGMYVSVVNCPLVPLLNITGSAEKLNEASLF